MRRANGRCSLRGLVWPSPDPTSSHLQTSDRVRIRQRQLLGETLATTPFRRQERDFLDRRDCGPKSAVCPSGERETQRTHWKSPPLVGIFGASPDVGRKRECVVVDAAPIEPVSAVKFPSIREKNREFRKFEGRSTNWPQKIAHVPDG